MKIPETPEKPELTVAAAVVIKEYGQFLLARKRPGLPNAGKWEFPGGKVEGEESPEKALERELIEELALVSPHPFVPLLHYRWEDSSRIIHFHFFIVKSTNFIPESRDHDDFAWITPGENVELDVVAADMKALHHLVAHPECLLLKE